MEEHFALRDSLVEDKELMRLASLVGTDSTNPERKLADHVSALIESEKNRVLFEDRLKTRTWLLDNDKSSPDDRMIMIDSGELLTFTKDWFKEIVRKYRV